MLNATLRRALDVWLPKLYLERFPILLLLFLPGYVLFAECAVPAMFHSTLVLTGRGLFLVTMFAFLTAMVGMALRRTVLLCGPSRFGVPWAPPPAKASYTTFFGHMAFALPLVGAAVWFSAADGLDRGPAVLWALAGFGAAAICQAIVLAIHAWFVDATVTLPDLVFPNAEGAFKRAHGRPAPQIWPARAVQRILLTLRPYLGPGYFTPTGQVEPSQLYAIGTCGIFWLVYGGLFFLGMPRYDVGVPALVFVLLLVNVVIILLAGVAFCLDRHHLPTLLLVGVWMTLLSWGTGSDHYFRLQPEPHPLTAPSPYELARARRPLVTVVAIDGGGIQAAAWAATVLTRLESAWPGFHRSVGVISAVSGGSVGTMYFVSAMHRDGPMTDGDLDGVRAAARRASLSEAAWGLAYGDVWRALVPPIVRFEKDRAWAMEQAWRRNFPPGQVPTLSDWIEGARAGWLPSVALNATVVESGQRFSFTTFRPPEAPQVTADDVRPWNLGTLLRDYPHHDIEMPTAARLTATFPYVTPIATARPEPGVPAWHFADGGYYDNTGMGIAMRWLDTALRGNPSDFTGASIAFIRIRSSPYTTDTPPKERAWAYDAIGPIETLVNVRNAGQLERAETELDFLMRTWHDEHVEITPFVFAFDLPGPPLSWQLTQRDVSRLDDAWVSSDNQGALRRLLALRDAAVAASGRAPAR